MKKTNKTQNVCDYPYSLLLDPFQIFTCLCVENTVEYKERRRRSQTKKRVKKKGAGNTRSISSPHSLFSLSLSLCSIQENERTRVSLLSRHRPPLLCNAAATSSLSDITQFVCLCVGTVGMDEFFCIPP